MYTFFMGLLICFSVATVASAQTINVAYTKYQKKPGNKAFAFHALGGWSWAIRDSIDEAKDAALRSCERTKSAHHGPCYVGDVNGKVVHKRFREVVYEDFIQPIKVEITDYETGRVRRARGTMDTGPIWSTRNVKLEIKLNNGEVICSGIRLRSIPKEGGSISGRCLGKFYRGKYLVTARRLSSFYVGSYLIRVKMKSADREILFTNIMY
jgi:hypothetical protein